ncbi:MAG: NADH-quinone oxidoreductase subunit C [Sedimentisphaerales bacterium]|nr:NADH-quinone oxidoreductase subunit C [Sedimentisphaerales bacterium]
MNDQELRDEIEKMSNKLIAIEQPLRNRYFLSCESQNAHDVCRFLFEDVRARFVIATAIDSDDCYEILYHFAYDELGTIIHIKAHIRDRENPSIESIAPFLPGAEWIEREIHDVMGIVFVNHPRLERLILADDWPDGVYPLRKEAKR